VLKRIRALFDAEEAKWMPMASTYRSGINIKFGKAHFDFLGQVTTGTADKQDWSKGAIMFDFPSFRPSLGDQKRYNEAFCKLFITRSQYQNDINTHHMSPCCRYQLGQHAGR
jgi:hypothetical protein